MSPLSSGFKTQLHQNVISSEDRNRLRKIFQLALIKDYEEGKAVAEKISHPEAREFAYAALQPEAHKNLSTLFEHSIFFKADPK